MDILLSPTNKEYDNGVPRTAFKIKEDWSNLRIGFTEPTIWTSWKKSGRINADAERFMVCLFITSVVLLFLSYFVQLQLYFVVAHGLAQLLVTDLLRQRTGTAGV